MIPDQVTTDGHGSHPIAIRSALGKQVEQRASAFKNNRREQDHRGIKGRIQCMRGIRSFTSAERFCRSHDELRNHLRPRVRHNQHVTASHHRLLHFRRAATVLALLEAAWADSVSRQVTAALARALTDPLAEAARIALGAECDHCFHRNLNRPEHGWLICTPCRRELTYDGYLARFRRVPEFRRFRAAVLRQQRRAQMRPDAAGS